MRRVPDRVPSRTGNPSKVRSTRTKEPAHEIRRRRTSTRRWDLAARIRGWVFADTPARWQWRWPVTLAETSTAGHPTSQDTGTDDQIARRQWLRSLDEVPGQPDHLTIVSGLPTATARIQYICELLLKASPDSVVDAADVREKLLDYQVDPFPARETISRTVAKWKRDRDQPSSAATSPVGTESDPAKPTPPERVKTAEPVQDPSHDHAAGFDAPFSEARRNSATSPASSTVEAAGATEPAPEPREATLQPRQSNSASHDQSTPQPNPPSQDPSSQDTRSSVAPDRPSTSPEAITVNRRQKAMVVRTIGYAILAVVAAAGAILSYESLRQKAAQIFGYPLAYGFPVAVDLLIVGASLAYLGGAMIGQGRPGWRLTAHAGVAATITLNALAADSWAGVPWHVAGPAVWSILVELIARDLLGDHIAATQQTFSKIPLALWLTAPRESAATWLRLRRQAAHAATRARVGEHDAALELLRMAVPGRQGRRTRKVIARQLRAGSVTPQAVVDRASAILADKPADSPEGVRRDVLTSAVTPITAPS